MTRCALVTGGAGFIGSMMVRKLLQVGWDVVVIDDLSSGREANLEGVSGSLRFIRGSILEEDKLAEAAQGADTIFHLAAQVSVPDSIEDPARNHEVNATGTARVYNVARSLGVRRVVFASSCAIYGANATLPKEETMAPEPLSPYAATKMLGELYGQCYSATMDLEVVSLRFFNVYGPRQNPAGGYAAAIPVFIDHFLRGAKPVIHGDGQQTRDFIYVGDVADACLKAADAPEASGQSINVGTGVETSVLEIVHGIASVLGSDLEVDFGPSRAGDIPRSVGSVERMRKLLGTGAPVPLKDGLRQTIAWYQGDA